MSLRHTLSRRILNWALIRRLIHAGKLKAYRIGPELRITEEQLDEYLRVNMSEGPVAYRNPQRLSGDGAKQYR